MEESFRFGGCVVAEKFGLAIKQRIIEIKHYSETVLSGENVSRACYSWNEICSMGRCTDRFDYKFLVYFDWRLENLFLLCKLKHFFIAKFTNSILFSIFFLGE